MLSLLPRIPWRRSSRPITEEASIVDYVLQPFFAICYGYMSFTLVRLFWAAILLPIYLLLAFYRSVWPFLLRKGHLLLTAKGRSQLVHAGEQSSIDRQLRAESQLRDDYVFAERDYDHGWHKPLSSEYPATCWPVTREYFIVCGLQACVVHEKPSEAPKRTVVLLHGNPSWSFMYRHIISTLVSQGFEVLALDWVGFGGSDKPLKVEEISFDLHVRTLLNLFKTYQLRDAYVLAHDWGGCVALCTIPLLERNDACTGLMLLNSFFPPRPSDITWNAYLLYFLWLSAQGVLAGLIPEEAIIRYMAPSVTETIAAGYAAPFSSARSKAAMTRFARMVPGTPQVVYDMLEAPLGRMVDGICPETSFSSLHEQASLRKRDVEVRRFWSNGRANKRVEVAFGDRDTLLGDFFPVLCNLIRTAYGSPKSHLLRGGGHYAAEEKPEELAEIFGTFAEHKS